MKLTLKIIALFLVSFTISCKKEIKDDQKKILLITKSEGWIRLKLEEKTASGTWEDITGNPLPTEKDNILLFTPWYTWEINEGALKLPGDDQIPFSGTWKLVEKGIQIANGNLMEIVELTETTLLVTTTVDNKTYRYTYVHP